VATGPWGGICEGGQGTIGPGQEIEADTKMTGEGSREKPKRKRKQPIEGVLERRRTDGLRSVVNEERGHLSQSAPEN